MPANKVGGKMPISKKEWPFKLSGLTNSRYSCLFGMCPFQLYGRLKHEDAFYWQEK